MILTVLILLSAPGHAGKSLEISNTVDIRSEVNHELVMRLVTDVSNGNRFYTDLNSFQVRTDALKSRDSLEWVQLNGIY